MSILSIFKGGKKAESNKGKAKNSENPNKPPPAPYKHIPRHAARDSLTLGPRGFDGGGSRASSRRHSTANIRGSAAMSRNNSGLSNVTTIHRGNSYNSGIGPLGGEWTSTTDQRRSRSMLQAPVGSIKEQRGPSPLKHQESSDISPHVSPEVSPKSSGGTSDSSSTSSQILEFAPNRQSRNNVTFHPTPTEITSQSHPRDSTNTDGHFPSQAQNFNLNGPSRPQPSTRLSSHYQSQNGPRRKAWETPTAKNPQTVSNEVKVDPALVEAKRKRWTFHGKKSTPTVIVAN